MQSVFLYRRSLLNTLYLFFVLITPAACSFNRGDRYWSGRPQPIGIDFTYDAASAVYADGPDNFTLLGSTGLNPGNDYAAYIHILYKNRDKLDVSPFVPSSYDDFPIEKWMFFALDYVPLRVSCYRKVYQERLCVTFYKTFSKLDSQELFWKCRRSPKRILRKRRSRYLPALIRQRMTWSRTPIPYKPMTRSNFVLAVHSMLVDLKLQALRDHNTTITSAIISLPPWIYNQRSDLVDEACLLANIEVIEPPHSSVDAATMSTNTTGAVLVLDYGQYHVGIYRSTRRMKAYEEGMTASAADLWYMSILFKLGNQIFKRYIEPNTTLVKKEDVKPGAWLHTSKQLDGARALINYGSGWPQDFEMVNRTIPIDVQMITGHPQLLDVSGEDIEIAEREFIDELSQRIQSLLSRRPRIWEYIQTLPEYSPGLPYKDYERLLSTVVTTHPPPPPFTSWIKPVSKVIVLSSPFCVEILYKAAFKALGWLDPFTTPVDQQQQCVTSYEIAARGVALRAREWVAIYDEEQAMHGRFRKCYVLGSQDKDCNAFMLASDSSLDAEQWQGVMGTWAPVVDLHRQFGAQL